MIEELLDNYSVDEFDNLLIEIIKQMIEKKESVKLEEESEEENG